MFTQLLTDLRILYGIINKMLQGKENLKQLHVNTEMKIFWEEYEPVFAAISKIVGINYDKVNEAECLALLMSSLNKISEPHQVAIGKELYSWLKSHKPKFLRDGIMHEFNVVGAKYLSPSMKVLMKLWWDIQVLLLESVKPPILDKVVDEDNMPGKVFCDYGLFLMDFQKVLQQP